MVATHERTEESEVTKMERLMTIDVNDLYKIDGGERYDMGEAIIEVAGKVTAWFKGLFD